MIDRRKPSEGGGDPDGFAGGAGDLPRGIDRRLVICAVASVAGHLAFAHGLDYLPQRERVEAPRVVTVRVIEPPAPQPPPEPPKPPEPPPEPAKPIVHERPRPQAPVIRHDAQPVDTPTDHPPVTTDTTTTPVFGVTMESTSQAGTGPAMPVGNTARPTQPAAPAAAAVKPLAEPIAATEATRMPEPRGVCQGKYTDEALAAGTEGVVVLKLIVDEHGRTRDIAVVSGLPHGLTEAAVAALAACPFTVGERNGRPVPVRITEFKVTFVLPEGR